ncbi:MAG: hypothetical protein J6T44_00055 [Prevotella sp.]|nr:hypothetical protein [Prevotella sp.]
MDLNDATLYDVKKKRPDLFKLLITDAITHNLVVTNKDIADIINPFINQILEKIQPIEENGRIQDIRAINEQLDNIRMEIIEQMYDGLLDLQMSVLKKLKITLARIKDFGPTDDYRIQESRQIESVDDFMNNYPNLYEELYHELYEEFISLNSDSGIINEENDKSIPAEDETFLENGSHDAKYYSADDLEIEHVYLDSKGKILESNSSTDNVPENEVTSEERKGKPWTENEEELITLFYKQCKNTATVAKLLGRTEIAIKMRLAKLGLIDYTYDQGKGTPLKADTAAKNAPDISDFSIKNNFISCSIMNKSGEIVFSTEGKLKFFHKKLYRFNLKDGCFTAKEMQFISGRWIKGTKKIVAYHKSELYSIIEEAIDYIKEIEDIEDGPTFGECRLKVNGVWYSYDGNITEFEHLSDDNNDSQFSVKIGDVLKLFPSQVVGTVTNLYLDSKGRRKINVKSGDGSIVSIFDNKYLYQKLYKQTPKIINKDRNREQIILKPQKQTQAKIGYWIQWKPTGDVGKVIGYKQVGSIQKLVLRRKDGSQLEVYDNRKAYEIILRT